MKQKRQKKDKLLTLKQILRRYHINAALVRKYGPPPIKSERQLPSGETQIREVWTAASIRALFDIEEVKEYREKRKEELVLAGLNRQAYEVLSSYSLDTWIAQGKQMERKFVLHVGPTNSGKTYDAMERLMQVPSGAYLGPLRLLALEMFEKLNGLGFPCNLLTGEESEEVPDARYVASTIELADFQTPIDLAVIDEAQLLSDRFRGANWTKAICLIPAREVHICLAPGARLLVEQLVGQLSDQIEVIEHERLAPLEFQGLCSGLNDVQDGDCVIAFSRRQVLAIAASLERMNIPCSVIYGALPPRARREEVRKYVQRETKAVVATDAIGMGVSLPIRRIIFSAIEKYDGQQRRRLSESEIKQIAGRAGRYGIFDHGEVLSMQEPNYVRRALEQPEHVRKRLFIEFPKGTLETDLSIRDLLETWNKMPTPKGFSREDVSEALTLLDYLWAVPGVKQVDKRLLYDLITCPVDVKNGDLVGYWRTCALRIIAGREIPLPWFTLDDLEGCELQYRAYDIHHQLLRRLGVEDRSLQEKEVIIKRIAELIREKGGYLPKCRLCGKLLPPESPYSLCERCYHRSFGWEWEE